MRRNRLTSFAQASAYSAQPWKSVNPQRLLDQGPTLDDPEQGMSIGPTMMLFADVKPIFPYEQPAKKSCGSHRGGGVARVRCEEVPCPPPAPRPSQLSLVTPLTCRVMPVGEALEPP